MKHTFKNENGHLIATVSFDQSEVQAAQTKAVRKLVQNVTVPGFRKGKAPLDRASRYLRSNDVADETINALLRALDRNFEADAEFKGYIDNRRFADNLRPSVALDKFTADEADFTVTYFLAPSVKKLGAYTGLKSDVKEAKVDDKRVEEEIKKLAEDNAELVPVEREAKMGDTVNIDFVGLMNGEPFEGGSSKGFDLELGSKHFVPGFEEQLVGHKAGEKVDVNLVLPDNYPEPLTSKPALFKVTINAVKEKQVPEINDEFATTLSGQYVAKDLAELKNKVKENLSKNALEAYKRDTVNDYLNQVRNASEFDICDEYLNKLVENREKQDSDNLENQGLSLDEYLKLIKQDKSVYEASLKSGVEGELKASLVYDAIAKAEKIPAPTQDEMAKQIGQPLNTFINSFTNYLRSQHYNDEQINNQINGYLNQVFSSILTAKVQSKVLELNDPELAKRTFEEPKAEEKKEEAPKAEEAKKEEAPKAEGEKKEAAKPAAKKTTAKKTTAKKTTKTSAKAKEAKAEEPKAEEKKAEEKPAEEADKATEAK